MAFRYIMAVSLCFASAQWVSGQVMLPATKDNSIVLLDGEWRLNAGEQGRIRIKANQHLVAIDFDTAAIKGKLIKKATLVCIQADQNIAGVTLSTIATPWDEGKSNGLTAGTNSTEGWGYPGARFPAVMGGSAFTLVKNTPSKLQEGAYHWDVPPDMVHALAIGAAHGLAIHEHDSDVGRNPTIFSREQSGKKPFLLVELAGGVEPTPQPATDLKLSPIDGGSAELSLNAPQTGFAYDVTIDGAPLGRHNIPFVDAGKRQRIPIRDLPSTLTKEGPHEVQVVTLNRTGKRSEPAKAQATLIHVASIGRPSAALSSARKTPIPNLGVIPLSDKYDKAGKPVGELPADYRTHNLIFDGQSIQLVGAAGEVIGFQLLLRGQGDVSLEAKLEGPPTRIDLQQAIYVPANGRLIPDPLLPLSGKLPLQADFDQAIFVDIYLPFDSQPGERQGSIKISDGRVVPLRVKVLPFALPKRATFLCEMNSYGLPDHVDDFYALQQVAYDHRVHANILHYSHHTAAPGARKSNLDMRLRSGRRMDNRRYDNVEPGATGAFWDDFTEAFGPYLDGSLFKAGHRGPIPAPGFYLTFHESWPLNCRAYFNGNLDAYQAFADKPVYAETYVNVLKDFARLAKAKGWNETGFQVYFNNKGSLQENEKAPWILDEPTSFWDYRALQYYGELTDFARKDAKDVPIDFRIDISRPEFCRGQLEGRGDLWVVSSWAFQNYRRLVSDRMQLDGLKVWVYGTSNHVHESNRNIEAWALDAWRSGASGLVPWQTVDKSGKALQEADQLGLFIFDKDIHGATVIRHSARLKAYRQAQQMIEYLNLLKSQRGLSQAQLRRFVEQYVPFEAEVRKSADADAGTTSYSRLKAEGMEELRLVVGELVR